MLYAERGLCHQELTLAQYAGFVNDKVPSPFLHYLLQAY